MSNPLYVCEIKYKCGHYRTVFIRSKLLAGKRYRDLVCPSCRAKTKAFNEAAAKRFKQLKGAVTDMLKGL